MSVSTFDPNEVDVIVDGFVITGFGDASDVISVIRGDDAWKLIQGTDGDSIFVKMRKKGGIVALKLLQSSASNDTLSTIENAAEIGIAVPVAIGIRDNNGTSLVAASKAFIMKIPDLAWGNDANDRVWPILCADLDVFAGGLT